MIADAFNKQPARKPGSNLPSSVQVEEDWKLQVDEEELRDYGYMPLIDSPPPPFDKTDLLRYLPSLGPFRTAR